MSHNRLRSSALPTGLDRPVARRFFIDEVDAASGAGGDWARHPDGDDSDAGDVRPKVPGMAMPAIGSTKLWKSST